MNTCAWKHYEPNCVACFLSNDDMYWRIRKWYNSTRPRARFNEYNCRSCQINMWTAYANLINLLCKLKVLR